MTWARGRERKLSPGRASEMRLHWSMEKSTVTPCIQLHLMLNQLLCILGSFLMLKLK